MPKNLPETVSRELRAANPRIYFLLAYPTGHFAGSAGSIRGTLLFLHFFILTNIMGSDPEDFRKTSQAQIHKNSSHI